MTDTDDRDPPTGNGSESGGKVPPPEHPKIGQPPSYDPDPDLITFLEREAQPGEVRVWHLDDTDLV